MSLIAPESEVRMYRKLLPSSWEKRFEQKLKNVNNRFLGDVLKTYTDEFNYDSLEVTRTITKDYP